jgi:hypothetical protein
MTTLAVEIAEVRTQDVHVDEERLVVDLTDGRTISAPLAWCPPLLHGNPEERASFETIGDGAYIRWPKLDDDLTVAGILAGRHSGESLESLQRWLASRK